MNFKKIKKVKGAHVVQFWRYKKLYALKSTVDSFLFHKIFETVSIALDDYKFALRIEEAKKRDDHTYISNHTKEYMKIRHTKFKYTKPVREIYFYRKKKKKRIYKNHPYWGKAKRSKYFKKYRTKLYKSIIQNYKKLKINKKIGVCLYTTLNNFYIIVIDYSIKSRPILSFVSGGMINSHKRFNRKRYHTVELCTRKISFFLKKHNLKIVSLFLYSFFRRKFLRVFLRGLKYHQVFLRRIYDFRRIPHNGCLGPKVRRI